MRLEEIIKLYNSEIGYYTISEKSHNKLMQNIKNYVNDCCVASLAKASENAKTIEKESTFESTSVNFPTYTAVDEHSIINPDNITLL